MSAIKDTIRMCVVCRGRHRQNALLRFQVIGEKILEFSKRGRSFYICTECICYNEDKLIKLLNSKLKMKNKKIIDFGDYFSKVVLTHKKEIDTNG